MKSKQTFEHRILIALGILIGLFLRTVILATGAAPFNSDEAVVALMARHTLQGAWPVFFYGQSYMGSLDATLIAGAFALLGESVLAIRLVQSALYLGIAATTYLLALRFFSCRWRAAASLLLVCVPSVLVSTYTTATLGGYGEVLLLGNLVLLLGHTVATDRPRDWRAWAGLGAAAGLGFWTSALISVYLLPVGALFLWRTLMRPGGEPRWKGVVLAAAAFMLFSGPWWWHNLTHDWSALRFMITGVESGGIGVDVVPFSTRLVGMLALGLPALLGMRFPWEASFFCLPLAVPALAIYLAAVSCALVKAGRTFLGSVASRPRFAEVEDGDGGVARSPNHARHAKALEPDLERALQARRQSPAGGGLLLGMAAAFAALFLLSSFGTDATGRYILPLVIPLTLWTADLLARARKESPRLALLGLFLLLGYNLLGNGAAIRQNPPGLTTQFHPITRFDNRHDQELVEFLRDNDLTRGYSNYWVAFRIAFLSHEAILLSAQLPYKPDFSYTPADDRYPPYSAQVDRADKVVYITSIHPALDALLAERLAAAGLEFSEKQIGPYHLFYDLTRRITPQELGFGHP